MTRIREAIGWLLYQLSRVGLQGPPEWFITGQRTTRGYGRLDFVTEEWQFPVRCLEEN